MTMPGMVFKRQVEGEVSKAEDCKVAVYSCPLDITQTETKVIDHLTADIECHIMCEHWNYVSLCENIKHHLH